MLTPESKNINDYLQVSEYLDHKNPAVVECARELSSGLSSDDHLTIAKRCFEFVRDQIKHTADYKIDIITCKASDVLRYQTGFCYAKSHLLAALLRANNIPAGLCYQRLSISDDENYASTSGEPYCSHGLNAIYLPEIGWYRVDPRGNKAGVDAQFTPPKEQLAFEINDVNEIDYKTIYVEPMGEVIKTLTNSDSLTHMNKNLPDKITTII